jgi:HEAT repeat protein
MLLSGIIGIVCGTSQNSPDLDAILTALTEERTSNEATQALLSRGNTHPEVRGYLARRLPTLLDQYKERRDGNLNVVWGNEARVAGELKIAEAAPVLAKRIDMLTSGPSGGSLGYNFLDYAAPEALISIGPPSVPYVIDVVKHGKSLQREIAAHVLRYIHTPEAWRALEEALPHEKDPKVRHRIQEALDSRR